MNTEKIIKEMMRENTGVHILDSGNDNDRHWQRNANRKFKDEPGTRLKFDIYNGKATIDIEHNTFHWLCERIEPNNKVQKLFNKFCKGKNESNLELMQEFPEWLEENGYGECSGIYGEGPPITVNTYNHSSLLDQTLQYLYFSNESGFEIILLQIHGGADVRGGYTNPKAFTVTDELAIFDDQRANIYCEKDNEHNWNTDDGYHFYFQGSCGLNSGTQLEEYDAKSIENKEQWEEGKLCVDKNGVGYCPHCGGQLSGSF